MAKFRMVNTRFWVDDYIANLDPIEKLLFLYFLTNPYTDICGVYEVPVKHIALETGLDKEMVLKIISRFEKDNRVYYESGWVAVVNFVKHQAKNPKVERGIEIGLSKAPKALLARLGIAYDSLSHSNSNSNSNSNSKIATEKPVAQEFSLKGEIKKLEDNPRRELNIIALYLEKRKPDLRTYEQYSQALKRHLRPAKNLMPFDDGQILKACAVAEKEYPKIWTIETLLKILVK